MVPQVTARLELAAQQAEQRSRSAADLRRLQEQREEKAAQEAAKLAEVRSLHILPGPLLADAVLRAGCFQHSIVTLSQTGLKAIAECIHRSTPSSTSAVFHGCMCVQAQAAEQKAAAGSAEHVEELRARIEARQRWLEGEEAALAAKITEATAPAAAERNRHLSAAAALRQEVEALRCALLAVPYPITYSAHLSLEPLFLVSDAQPMRSFPRDRAVRFEIAPDFLFSFKGSTIVS